MERRDFMLNILSGLIGVAAGLGSGPAIEYAKDFNSKDENKNPEENEDSIESIEEKENNLSTKDDASSYGALGYFSEDTIEKLKEGGYVIYFRHEDTQSGKDQQKVSDSNETRPAELPEWDFNDCRLQRNLSLDGWRRARNTGKAFNMLNVELNAFSSPWCRCRKHAELVIGDSQIVSELDYSKEDNSIKVRELFSQVDDNTNTAIFGHSFGSMELSHLMDDSTESELNEGQAILLDPKKEFEESVIDGPGI